MTHEELVDYIKKATDHGMSNDEIRANLVKSGWDAVSIDAAFAAASGMPAVPVAPGAAASQGNANALLPAFTFWGQAWGIFKKRMGVFVGIAAVPAVLNGLFQALVGNGSKTPNPWFILVFIPLIVFQILSALAYIYAAKEESQTDVIKVYRLALGKFWRIIWLGIISSFVDMGMFMLGFIPGIIIGIWFAFSIYVLALEDQGGMNALFTSREYVRGNWWPVLGYLLLPILTVALPMAIVSGILGALKIPFAQAIVGLATVLLLTPLTAIYNYLVYDGFKKYKGAVSPILTTGRKTKYIVLALVGFIVPILLIGSSLAMLFSAFGNFGKGKLPINSLYQGSSQQLPSSEELNKLMQQFQNINTNPPSIAPPGGSGNNP